jgi:hypothetical protein
MPDEQDNAEALDDDVVWGDDPVDEVEFPPDRLSPLSRSSPLDADAAGDEARPFRDEPVGRLAEAPDDNPYDGVGESDVLAEAYGDGGDLAAEEEAVHLTEGAP